MLYPVVQALFCVTAALAAPDPILEQGWKGTPVEAGLATRPVTTEISLDHAYRYPTQNIGRTVRLTVQLDEELSDWNPFHTRFGPERYRAFRVWSDDQRLWDAEQFYTPLGRIFVRRGSLPERSLLRAARFQRFVVHGTVRQALLGEPWIEIEHAFKNYETVGEGTLLHASRGLNLLKRGALQMARQELERALVPNLPKAVREDLLKLLLQTNPS